MYRVTALPAILLVLCWHPASCGFACLSNPCIHGVCLDDLNTTYSCYCVDGYTGVQCQTNWDECWSNPCHNGGLCLDGIAAFNCTCPPGFVGDLCEENLNECLSNPCQNNATCLDAANGYFCNCLPGYSGTHCEFDIAVCNLTNETRCSNGGVCIEGPGITFSCRCPDGWSGLLCEIELDECASHPCQNGALCVDLHADYECACPFGYAGKQCEEMVMVCSDNPCRNGALCLMEDDKPVCYCVPDYHGHRCQFQYDECKLTSTRCLNGGSCIDGIDGFTCSCPPSLTGVYCECQIVDIKGKSYLDCSYSAAVTQQINITATYATTLVTVLSTETEHTDTSPTIKTDMPTTHTSIESTTAVPSMTEQTTIKAENNTEGTASIHSITTATGTTTATSTNEHITTTINMDVNATTVLTSEEPLSSSTYSSSTNEEVMETTTPSSTSSMMTTTSDLMSDGSVTFTTSTNFSESSTIVPINTSVTWSTGISEETSTATKTTSNRFDYTNITTETITEIISTESESAISSLPSTTEQEASPTSIEEITTISTTAIIIPTNISKSSTNVEFTTETITESITTYLPGTTNESSTFSTLTIPPESSNLTDIPTTTFTESPTTYTHVSETESELESTETSTVTALPPFDCSKLYQHCQNGGTCVYTEGFACVCPYDYTGLQCETLLGIRSAAFSGHSYLIHQVHVTSRLQIDFRARTTATGGLLFYVTIGNTYMALYIEQGHLKFMFSCGSETMLLSELNKSVNNGHDMRISVLLTFADDRLHCNASIKLNDSVTMSGAQLAKIDQYRARYTAWLYLGGLNEISNPVAKIPGFIGCISDLSILGKDTRIFNDAENGYQISECSSLACLSQPCQNGGSCTTVQQGTFHNGEETFFCLCPNGFVGTLCEAPICANNPCMFGGTCLSYTGSGFICMCPFGKHGQFCENDLKISRPHFSSSIHGYSSFAAYRIPRSSYKFMNIRFKIAPSSLNQISLLMFLGQHGDHDFYSDHMAVSFIKGYIMLTWNLGAGPRRIFTSTPIPPDKSHYEIELGRSGRSAWLHVEYLGNVTGRSQGTLSQLDVEPMIFFGGYRSKHFDGLPHDLPLHGGFSGCIYDMEFRVGDVTIALTGSSAIGRAVGQCGTTECYEGICQNLGACLYHSGTFTCLCQEGFYGPLCSLKMNPCNKINCANGGKCQLKISGYECDCPLGYKGKYCAENEALSDVNFTGVRSFLVIGPQRTIASNKFNFDLELRPTKDGVVAFLGSDETFFCLTLLSGLIELRILPKRSRTRSQEILILRSNKLLRWGIWHQIRVQIYGRKVYLFVDNIVDTSVLQPGSILDLSNENVYLGGLPDLSKLPLDATSELANSYTGCMRKLFIEHLHISLNAESILAAQNIADCDGTPCGGDYCSNGGSCWLDPHLAPRCNCPEPFYGDQCEHEVNCTHNDRKCKNDGYCVEGRCICKLGYIGALCETGLTIKSPKFSGKSYLFVNIPQAFNTSGNLAKMNKKRNLIGGKRIWVDLQIEFSTASGGLLLYVNNTKNNSKSDFFAIGINYGKLILMKPSLEILEFLGGPLLDDGFRHLIDIIFNPFRIYIDSQAFNVTGFENIDFSKFYFGGVPPNFNNTGILTSFFGNAGFKGCLIALSGNQFANKQIEFNSLQGENIGDCSSDRFT